MNKIYVMMSILLCLMLLPITSFAEDKGVSTIDGTIVCVDCTLKKQDAAQAQCKIFGHKHGLMVSTGTIYSFIENEKSKDVINSMDYHNAKVNIKGKVHHSANMISLESIEVQK